MVCKKRSKLISAIGIVLTAVSVCGMFTGCGVMDNLFVSEEIIDNKPETQQATNETTTTKATEAEVQKILSPESAVQIYVNNKSDWMIYNEYGDPMYGYYYGFLDLDFDGVLELITNTVNGTGRFSDNHYYRLDVENQTVAEMELSDKDHPEGYGYDYGYSADFPVLYKNKKTGEMKYMMEYFCYVFIGEFANTYDELFVKNGKIQTPGIFHEYYQATDDGSELATAKAYQNYGEKNISKEKYEKARNDYNKQNGNLNLKAEFINGSDINSAGSNSEIYDILLSNYENFSYNGFSFSDLETYDINFPDEKDIYAEAMSKNLMDYKGFTINDMAKLWGDDYIIASGLYKGGWKDLYYDKDICPMAFYVQEDRVKVESYSGTEKLCAVQIFPKKCPDYTYYISDGVSTKLSYREIKKVCKGTNKQFYENMVDGGYNFSYEYNGMYVICNWQNSVEDIPDSITVEFDR